MSQDVNFDNQKKVAMQEEALDFRKQKQGKPRVTGFAPTRVLSFTSGKGGVGKTSLVINVGLSLVRLGKSVLVIDGDLGLANVDVLLGLRPKHNLSDLFSGSKTLEDLIVSGPEGLSIIPAASGLESMCNLSNQRRMHLLQAVENMSYSFEYILIDTPAGIGPDVMYFNGAAAEVICVISSEPTSLTDAYALIKVLAQEYGEKRFTAVVNNVATEFEALKAFKRLQSSVERFLHVHLNYLGFVPRDAALCEAVCSQKALLELFPSSPAGRAIAGLSKRLDESYGEYRLKGGMQFFFEQLLELSADGNR